MSMDALLRSEEMTLCQMFLQSEAAYACVSELGEIGLVQFRDLNPDVNAFQRKFVSEIRRCEEMERKLRFLEKEINKDGIPMLNTGDNPEAPAPREMIDLEATYEKLENEMKEVNSNSEALKRNFLELTELKHILRKTQTFFEETMQGYQDPSLSRSHYTEPTSKERNSTNLIVGFSLQTSQSDDQRSSTCISRFSDIVLFIRLKKNMNGDSVHKSVFIIFFQGEQLKSRIKKICEGYRATLYPCPETQAERREMAIGVMTRIEDLNTVLGQTQDHRHRVLVAAAKNIKVWSIKVRKIKAIYHTLNMFNLDVTQKCLIAECWCPVADLDRIQQALRSGTERSGSSVPSIINRMQTRMVPPTYNRCNKFTQGFQNIVDAYGVACYREVNPAPFTCITFPFLFAVMFGDMGHGAIMFLFALFLVLKEKQLQAKKIQNEIFSTFFGGRYIILLMGAFSIYTGLIYNDVFSKSLNLFGCQWVIPATDKAYDLAALEAADKIVVKPNGTFTGSSYPIGVDPIWSLASNKIAFTNSLKMKMSIILGIFQMFFGISLSYLNHRHFQKPLNIIFDFIPMVVFLFCMFGYLVILVFVKWLKYSSTSSQEPPSLLIVVVVVVVVVADYYYFCYCYYYCFLQQGFQSFLVVVAVLCVPWMMLGKPMYMRYMKRYGQVSVQNLLICLTHCFETKRCLWYSALLLNVLHEEFSEVLIHQVIHTIEFCLGCISHTASYLRLWALSLAHAQLSEVLWQMVLRIAFGFSRGWGAIALFIIFQVWAALTVMILVLMEGLSAFLHALRLHWVEFQSKFYDGSGHIFVPFSFNSIADASPDE
ncbi:hypothetical protein EGW08_021387 [Elysia chlorotica]|uniref:V-type proton ATPase subunit a n=1 Tax=Elysia chlorotica TaxID=188477 RepID=A0A3S1AXH4_ELYCH|nr:hypothetical protein EGW08_021387 [Elysia chlorotica]